MRIACIHIPQFALQCATRLDPSLRGAAVAVVSGTDHRPGPLHAPIVVACSRAAWAVGVRLGMTATAARALAASVTVVGAEPAIERETVRAVADSLLGVAGPQATVDLGGRVGVGGAHLAMYAEVPAKTRGASFGDRLLERLGEIGLTGRIGIADDRFTAWVAAAHGGDEHGVVVVPRGGSAAFLAPRPLSLLAITPEVQHMLEALGVRSLGEFAALPAPSVARPLEADYQALARGDGGTQLRAYVPEASIREEIVVSSGNVLDADGAVSGPAAIAIVARRIALRLEGRGRCAARLEVTAGTRDVPVALDRPVTAAEDLARTLALALDGAVGPWRLRVVVASEALAGEPGAAAVEVFARASVADPLTVALSTSASLFAPLTLALQPERRDVHRRTRRGKQRRGRPTAVAQSRLFDRSSS